MPSLREYLPGVPQQYWSHYMKGVKPPKYIAVEPGAVDQSILPTAISDERGLFSAFGLTSSSADLVFTITIDDNTISAPLSTLSAGGYVGYFIPGVPFLSIDGTGTPAIYVVNLIYPDLVPFFRNVNVSVANPTSASIIISATAFDFYLLRPGFYKALADLVQGKEQIIKS